MEELADSRVRAFQSIDRNGRRQSLESQVGAFREYLSARIVNDHARKAFSIAEALDDSPELFARSSLQSRLDDFLEALAKNFRATLQIGAKPPLLRADFVPGDDKCNQGDSHHQEKY